MFGNHFIADRIAKSFYHVDQDLRQRVIRRRMPFDEDQYTTLFTEHINAHFVGVLPIFTSTCVLRRPHEQRFGCDGIIIFHHGQTVKICLFEAKWPIRVNWDYPQDPHPSHFTYQIERQRKYNDVFAIWEMFYDSRPLENSFIPGNNGSACSWHDETYNFQIDSVINRTWKIRDVKALTGIHGQTIYQIIYSIIMSKKGVKHNTDGTNEVVLEMKDQYFETIPLPFNYDADIEKNEDILSFMQESGLGQYIAINFPDLDS